MKQRIEAFLVDLAELSRRHGIVVSGCGCCGSPRLEMMDAVQADGQYMVAWCDDNGATSLHWGESEVEASNESL